MRSQSIRSQSMRNQSIRSQSIRSCLRSHPTLNPLHPSLQPHYASLPEPLASLASGGSSHLLQQWQQRLQASHSKRYVCHPAGASHL